ncbi:TylF/MycF/NovP-related O-methyltransferase [Aminobacter sp. LjRoot7]|uniref:TylF/MycF/NovP-related O-methyltransferase n=1 Tax=Aminobacter sp. LjRoot7 TaxID=3342335 RepID=UPI003F4FF03E
MTLIFYSSTRIELETLYPWLVSGGALIVDDYGFFQGARTLVAGNPLQPEWRPTAGRQSLSARIESGRWIGARSVDVHYFALSQARDKVPPPSCW